MCAASLILWPKSAFYIKLKLKTIKFVGNMPHKKLVHNTSTGLIKICSFCLKHFSRWWMFIKIYVKSPSRLVCDISVRISAGTPVIPTCFVVFLSPYRKMTTSTYFDVLSLFNERRYSKFYSDPYDRLCDRSEPAANKYQNPLCKTARHKFGIHTHTAALVKSNVITLPNQESVKESLDGGVRLASRPVRFIPLYALYRKLGESHHHPVKNGKIYARNWNPIPRSSGR
jgi:hypothetical protein